MNVSAEITALKLTTYEHDGLTRIRVPVRGASQLLTALRADPTWRRVSFGLTGARGGRRAHRRGEHVVFERGR